MHLTVREVYIHQTENHMLWFHHVMNDDELKGENNETVNLASCRDPRILPECLGPNLGSGTARTPSHDRGHRTAGPLPSGDAPGAYRFDS